VSPADERREGGFLARWSRRKQENRAGLAENSDAPEKEPAALAPEAEQEIAGSPATKPEDPLLAANRAAAEAIGIDSLTDESDFTVFMKEGVPQALKNQALRKLWRTNPAFAVLDGLNDYDINFRTADKVLTTFQSAWEVGRGYAAKAEEMAAKAAEHEARAHEEQAGEAGSGQIAQGGSAGDGAEDRGDETASEPEPGSAAGDGHPRPVTSGGADSASRDAGSREPVAHDAAQHATKAQEGGPQDRGGGQDEPVAKVPIRRRMQVRFES